MGVEVVCMEQKWVGLSLEGVVVGSCGEVAGSKNSDGCEAFLFCDCRCVIFSDDGEVEAGIGFYRSRVIFLQMGIIFGLAFGFWLSYVFSVEAH